MYDTRQMPIDCCLDMLACPRCRGALERTGRELTCQACRQRYPFLANEDVPVLMGDEPDEDARVMKMETVERFTMIDDALPLPFAPFASFLNLGYVPSKVPQYAARAPSTRCFSPNSVKLLFEVIGDCELDGCAIVELGAGRGGNLAMIEAQYSPRRLIGIDLCPANVAFCHLHHELHGGAFVVGDVEQTPIADSACDVVLNLESSHYYPRPFRFFDETHRILRECGTFLYADILPAEAFLACETYLATGGRFDIIRNQDISENVLLSCEEISKIRQSRRDTGLYDAFEVVPGSLEFEELRSGGRRYKILVLKKR